MKQSFIVLSLLWGALSASAREGYRIQVRVAPTSDSVFYLAKYYGKALPTIYKIDSARISQSGTLVFDRKERITGGIYLIMPSSKKSYFEIFLNNGDDLSLAADMSALPQSLKAAKGSENEDFFAYQRFLRQYATRQDSLKTALTVAKTRADSALIQQKSASVFQEVQRWRDSFRQQKPRSFMTVVFKAADRPQAPQGMHTLPDGSIDSNYAWRYYRKNYWLDFSFSDDRLIHTPILDGKLDEYFNRVLPQQADTVIAEGDSLLARMRRSENLFKYTLNWLSTNAQTSRVMGMDKAFVHLVEQYYQKGEATWLKGEELDKFIKRAREIAPNLIGSRAPQLRMVDSNKVERPLLDVDARFTLLVFWEPSCGHCMQEIPKIDSLYRTRLKQKGVRIYAVLTDPNEETAWKDFIRKHDLGEWTHVYDFKRNTRYYELYDVKTTPVLYLLDGDKKIIGKKINHTGIESVIRHAEMQRDGK